MADMQLEGIDSLIHKLEDMGKAGAKVQNSALKKAGEVINEEIKANAPTSSSPRPPRGKTQMWRTGKHAKELLKVSGVKSKNGIKHVDVGLQKGDTSKAFYLKFYEFGSSKTPATHFMGKAYESKKEEAKEVIKQEIKNALGL
ncbi:hypothetical protein G8V03_09725 [Clostridium botulinum D/C]|uniref:HK97-gp10 family putative phage morphogenesis protein n=1 Tax=Clostridium botulinum TaxID=1491 RepID=UPI001E518839|nr:HK97-gp10 family putative phage morphogenesis protein [Clostridium botulinum]MCD3351264.1 hypothetical protein [Clostridium botulinum D/C]MCD3360221.1 hypothetical protein [Clostridium botulinum D/C]MCD3361676.1 hypothetical protein [Clostridium botulinum D/C]MCD3366026.1 hypothetical protein [Clostridium botulinum D/C]